MKPSSDQRRHQFGGGSGAAGRGASGPVRSACAPGRARCLGRAARPRGCGGAHSRCAVFHLEQGHGGQGSARALVTRGRPRGEGAHAARRFRHGAFRRRAARHRQSSQHRGADVQSRRRSVRSACSASLADFAAPTGGCTTSRSSRTGRSRSSAAAISATNISGRVTRTITPISIWRSSGRWSARFRTPSSFTGPTGPRCRSPGFRDRRRRPRSSRSKRAGLIEHYTTAVQSEYADTVRDSEFARQFQDSAVTWFWSRAIDRQRSSRQGAHLFHEGRDAPRAQAARTR